MNNYLEVIQRKDAKALGRIHYYTGKPCKFGHIELRTCCDGRCTLCSKIYRANNSEKVASQKLAWKHRNPEKVKADRDLFWEKNPHKRGEYSLGRQRMLANRVVRWADEGVIRGIYEERDRLNLAAGEYLYAVDHVIPLKGKLVSGLHVHNNLQILTRYENSRKNNKFTP